VKRALNCHLQLSLNREPLKIRLLKIDTQHTFVSARPSARHCVCRESGNFREKPHWTGSCVLRFDARARARTRAHSIRRSLTRAMDFYSDILIRRLNRTRRLSPAAAGTGEGRAEGLAGASPFTYEPRFIFAATCNCLLHYTSHAQRERVAPREGGREEGSLLRWFSVLPLKASLLSLFRNFLAWLFEAL